MGSPAPPVRIFMRRPLFLSLGCAAVLFLGCAGTSSKTTVTISVAPTAVSVAVGNTQQFTATVTGTSNTAVTWSVAGGAANGTISITGLYTAPAMTPNPPQATVTAVSQADSSASGSATVTIQPGNQNAQYGAIQLGTSGGNANDSSTNTTTHTITCCGATLGSLVTRGGTQYILSNTHVLARSDIAQLGDPIIQPALIDNSTCTSSGARTVANLSAFYNLQTGALPKIDAAIAQIVPGNVDTSGNILYLGATADTSGVPMAGAPH